MMEEVAFEKELEGVREHVRVGAVLYEQLDDIKPTCQGLLQSVSRTIPVVSINWCQYKEVEQYIQWKAMFMSSDSLMLPFSGIRIQRESRIIKLSNIITN